MAIQFMLTGVQLAANGQADCRFEAVDTDTRTVVASRTFQGRTEEDVQAGLDGWAAELKESVDPRWIDKLRRRIGQEFTPRQAVLAERG